MGAGTQGLEPAGSQDVHQQKAGIRSRTRLQCRPTDTGCGPPRPMFMPNVHRNMNFKGYAHSDHHSILSPCSVQFSSVKHLPTALQLSPPTRPRDCFYSYPEGHSDGVKIHITSSPSPWKSTFYSRYPQRSGIIVYLAIYARLFLA